MEETPESSGPGAEPREGSQPQQRMLAAIVFTDAVSFSKLAGQDERAAFRILQRDFGVMQRACATHGGKVLNTMGDGMLMCFGSAVEAMQCALRIQQDLHESAKRMPAIAVLQHRIGVHIGDIIIDGENVFGDGVNVASRLQTECKPGAIAYSRMVADVIKNKVTVNSKFMGLKHLKNIAEPVPVYQVPALSELEIDDAPTPEAEPEEGASGGRALALVAGSLALFAIAAGGIYYVTQLSPDQATTSRFPTERRAAASPTPGATPSPSPASAVSVAQTIASLSRSYDFDAAASAAAAAPDEALRAKADRYRNMARLMGWLQDEFAITSSANPVRLPVGKAYRGTTGIRIEASGGIRETGLRSLEPAWVVALASAAASAPPSGAAAPTDVNQWIQDFSAEFGL